MQVFFKHLLFFLLWSSEVNFRPNPFFACQPKKVWVLDGSSWYAIPPLCPRGTVFHIILFCVCTGDWDGLTCRIMTNRADKQTVFWREAEPGIRNGAMVNRQQLHASQSNRFVTPSALFNLHCISLSPRSLSISLSLFISQIAVCSLSPSCNA